MAAINVQNDIDMHQFQILNWVCQVLSADPTSPKQGQVYFNSTSNRWRVFNGSTWDEYATAAELAADLSGKVDKVEGKQLSTEDFTTALKTKLDGIAAGAEVNVSSFTGTIEGDGSKTVFTFNHGLGKAGMVQVKDSSGGQVWVANSCTATQVSVTFGTAPASGVTYTVRVVG